MNYISTDPIADMLTRLRNAIAVRKTDVIMPHSKSKEAIAMLLKSNGFINNVKISDLSIGKSMTIVVNTPDENAKITEIIRLSSPGRRNYTGANKIPTVKHGRGLVIISTSKGIMTGQEAKKLGIGGELICQVY